MLPCEYLKKLFPTIAVSFFLFLISVTYLHSQTAEKAAAIFVLKGNTIMASSKNAVEGVDLELKKNGQTISKMQSGKKGKYYIQMEVSTTDKNNEYLLYITQPGTIPKTVSISTYIPQTEFNSNPFPRYDYTLEIKMTETTEKDIVVGKASARINWDPAQRGFAFDQTFAKVTQLKDDPDKLLQEAAEKKKREEEELTRRKAEDEARLKAEEEKHLADQHSKEEADRILQKNLEAMKQNLRKKRMQDSLDSLASHSTANVEVKKLVKPVSIDDVDPNGFDGTNAYSINIAQRILKVAQEKLSREKAANMSAKYETNNTLTSLLNVVDEFDKNEKTKSQ